MDTAELLLKGLAIKGVSDSVKIVTETAADLTKQSFTFLLKPALEESGLCFRDMVKEFRQRNALAIATKADERRPEGTSVNPMLALRILDAGSYTDDVVLQNLWVGLLASSCTEAGDDDSNKMFLNIVANMTRNQATIIDWLGRNLANNFSDNLDGTITSHGVFISRNQFREITSTTDDSQLISEIQLLEKGLGLIYLQMTQPTDNTVFHVGLTTVGLLLFARCQGSRKSLAAFYNLSPS